MLSVVEKRVNKLDMSIEEMKESHDALGRNDALKAMVIALKEETMAMTKALNTRIEEFQGDLALCRATVGNGVPSASLNCEDVLKLKEFARTRSACGVDNFLWRMKNYFRAKSIMNDASKDEFKGELKGLFYPEFTEEETQAKLRWLTQQGIVEEYVREFKESMLQILDVIEKEALLAFKNGLKLWVRKEVEQEGVQELLKAMTVAESVVKLNLGKDKLESSKSKEMGICEGNHKKNNDSSGNGNDGGNGKPRVGKKKPNKKMGKLKFFLCDGPHLLKKCLKKSELSKKDKPKGKATRLGSSARGAKAKEAECEKKLVECFLCHGVHRLRKCPKKSTIEGGDALNEEPKNFGSNKRKV
ncbi:hypothetical protein J1N35_006870 [Gossypium stocksii]|uniref:Retrotransposon gag domain-containing protein n=1 Tax=Gossypium stocksii TaxID=47602 RepID=A0A9D3W6N0_9ROSI|nr:hypothetical protein J1N35_006870 [Gossypium stocksii]